MHVRRWKSVATLAAVTTLLAVFATGAQARPEADTGTSAAAAYKVGIVYSRTGLLAAGPNVFAGYWRNPEATAAAFADGWLLTGDVAARDEEGYYRIVGRTKDMVISGGENVYLAEIENVLHEHPAVAEAAVVGVPDERWGEACLAFVVASGQVSEEALLEHCRARLAGYKVPRAVRFVDSLPRNALDKIVKSELLELVR